MTRLSEFGVGQNVAVPAASEGAARYANEMGLVRPNRFDNVIVNYPQGRKIAQEYEAAPSFDPAAVPHYKAMAEETKRQFDFLTSAKSHGGLGVDVSVSDTDPYKKAADMMKDAATNKFQVLSTAQTGGHPYFSNDENDMFRAVHDYFGHAATGRGFDPHGEEAAFRSHYAMFSPKARPAMATETRGQNSAINFGSNPGNFVEQKVATLPSAQLITPIGRRSAFNLAVVDAKRAHAKMLKGFDRSE
jgi:hypothetical protein